MYIGDCSKKWGVIFYVFFGVFVPLQGKFYHFPLKFIVMDFAHGQLPHANLHFRFFQR